MATTWHNIPTELSLSEDSVEVFRINLEQPGKVIDDCLKLLSAEEVERMERFKVSGKRREYILSRGSLRKRLGHLMGIDPCSFNFAYAEHEKPYLKDKWNGHSVEFNLTHSHNQTLIAITLNRVIGIDIEYIRHDVEFTQLAKRFFSEKEAKELSSYNENEIARAFYACWTRKEAFVKALGDGITYGLSEFCVSLDPEMEIPDLCTYRNENEASNWSMLNIQTDADYLAAIVLAGSGVEIRYWE